MASKNPTTLQEKLEYYGEQLLFASRWLLAPFYLGLAVSIDRTRITGPTVLRVGAKVRVGRTTLQLQR